MIRPGSLDIMPDCLDYEAARPAPVAHRRDYLSLALGAALVLTVGGTVAMSLFEALSAAACPLWILQGTSGALVWSC